MSADIQPVLTRTLLAYEPGWEGPIRGDKGTSAIFDNSKIKAIATDWQCEVSLSHGLQQVAPFVAERQRAGYQPDPALDALIDKIIANQR